MNKSPINTNACKTEPRNFIFGLFRRGVWVDQTSLDENDPEFAEELFFGEFGHRREKDHTVELIEVSREE